MKLPTTRHVADVTYTKVQKPGFHRFENIDYIFPLFECQAAVSTLESKANDYNAIKAWRKYFSIKDLGNMITAHKLIKVKADVEQEMQWFQQEPKPPTQTCIVPNNKAVKEFEKILLSNPNGKVLHNKYTITEDFATFCCSRWISLQAIDPMISIINEMNPKRKVILHGMVSGMSVHAIQNNLLSMGDWHYDLDTILIILNVTKNARQNTVVSSETVKGSHWSILKLDLKTKSYVYLDTLGYSTPINLHEKVNPLIQATGRLIGVELPSPGSGIVGRAHRANCNKARTACSNDCLKAYPLQQCSSICGPITILMSALCVGAPEVLYIILIYNRLCKKVYSLENISMARILKNSSVFLRILSKLTF